MKKDMLTLARKELYRLDQTVRDCSDRLADLSPLDLESGQYWILTYKQKREFRVLPGLPSFLVFGCTRLFYKEKPRANLFLGALGDGPHPNRLVSGHDSYRSKLAVVYNNEDMTTLCRRQKGTHEVIPKGRSGHIRKGSRKIPEPFSVLLWLVHR